MFPQNSEFPFLICDQIYGETGVYKINKRIAIDQDEVIADFLAKAISFYNKEYHQNITTVNLVQHLNANPIAGDILFNYMEYENFCSDLEVIKDSQKVILELSQKFEVLIVSAATLRPKTMMDKLEWISKYFCFIPREKKFKGKGLLFTNPYNKDNTEFARVNNWEEIAKIFL